MNSVGVTMVYCVNVAVVNPGVAYPVGIGNGEDLAGVFVIGAENMAAFFGEDYPLEENIEMANIGWGVNGDGASVRGDATDMTIGVEVVDYLIEDTQTMSNATYQAKDINIFDVQPVKAGVWRAGSSSHYK